MNIIHITKMTCSQHLSIPENEDCTYIRYLKQVKNLLCNILLLNICTLLLYFIRMYAQSCFPISFFNWSTRNQISQRYRLPPTFRPEHLNIIQKCKNWFLSNEQYTFFAVTCFFRNLDEMKTRIKKTHILQRW